MPPPRVILASAGIFRSRQENGPASFGGRAGPGGVLGEIQLLPYAALAPAMSPPVRISGPTSPLAAVDTRVHAVAVVLDFVQPALARRRLIYPARELWLDPPRQRCRSHRSQWSTIR